jgi:tetratricopeptide (TPR) repeat protein
MFSGSPTVDLLMSRSQEAASANARTTQRALLDAAIKLAPEYAEGWNERAALDFNELRFDDALSDLSKSLAADPRHVGALEGLAKTLEALGRDDLALKAYRKLQGAYPGSPTAKSGIEELEVKVEGQRI